MGKRGPKPLPVETLKLHGSNAQYRRQGEVSIVDGEPVKPDGLGVEGASMWDRMVVRMRNQGILSEAWQESLTVLCQLWERVCDVMDDDECERKELLAVVEAYRKWSADFGLTPASKTGIRTEPKPAGKDKGRFVKGMG